MKNILPVFDKAFHYFHQKIMKALVLTFLSLPQMKVPEFEQKWIETDSFLDTNYISIFCLGWGHSNTIAEPLVQKTTGQTKPLISNWSIIKQLVAHFSTSLQWNITNLRMIPNIFLNLRLICDSVSVSNGNCPRPSVRRPPYPFPLYSIRLDAVIECEWAVRELKKDVRHHSQVLFITSWLESEQAAAWLMKQRCCHCWYQWVYY